MSPPKKNIESLSFEEAFSKLEKIADRLENGDISLNASMQAFEEGMALVNICIKHIDKAETRLKKLVRDAEGRFQLEIMTSDE